MKSTNNQNKNPLAPSIIKKYTTQRTLRNGAKVVFRPIECTDQSMFKEFFKALSPASVHFRFFEVIKDLPSETVEKYCNIDYSQEMAIVAQPQGEGKIVAVARLEVNHRRHSGEFALVIADAWQGLGLGSALLDYIIEIARNFRLEEIHCFVTIDNNRMILLAKKAGLKVKYADGDILEMTMRLDRLEEAPMA